MAAIGLGAIEAKLAKGFLFSQGTVFGGERTQFLRGRARTGQEIRTRFSVRKISR
jgi:hypothetical protein